MAASDSRDCIVCSKDDVPISPERLGTAKDSKACPPCYAYSHSQCPLNRRELGRSSWAFLHTMAAYYPEKPSKAQEDQMTTFMTTFVRYFVQRFELAEPQPKCARCFAPQARVYPCGYCADTTSDEIERNPPRVSSQIDLSMWMCELHNEVNDRMGKPLFDCSTANLDKRWKSGPADGSCRQ